MKTIQIIILREFLSRVRKKSFIIMTLIGPILLGTVMVLPAFLASQSLEEREILVVDPGRIIYPNPGNDEVQLNYLEKPGEWDAEAAKAYFEESEAYALLYLPTGSNWDPDFIAKNATVYGKNDVSLGTQSYLKDLIRNSIQQEKLKLEGVDPAILAQTKTDVSLRAVILEGEQEKASATEIKTAVAFIAGFLIYLFIFLFGAQVMRGVIEEKTSRIVEVIISSVKPFQLMMGKITGIALVGLLQFLIWVVLVAIIYSVSMVALFPDGMDPQQLVAGGGQLAAEEMTKKLAVIQALDSINFGTITSLFLFYFMGGYLLYGSLFAAIGSAVDSETDTQQFMLPITVPLILSIALAMPILENPDSNLAFWMSMVPLTSPIAMMIRIPFGVPVWEIALSMTLLAAGFIFTTWLAGRIYRIGILMYGKKVNYKELAKWIRYNP